MKEVLFRPNKTIIHEAVTGNNFCPISTGNGQSQFTKIVLKRKNF